MMVIPAFVGAIFLYLILKMGQKKAVAHNEELKARCYGQPVEKPADGNTPVSQRERFIRERAKYIAHAKVPEATAVLVESDAKQMWAGDSVAVKATMPNGDTKHITVMMNEIYGGFVYVPVGEPVDDEPKVDPVKEYVVRHIGNLKVKMHKCTKKGFNSFVYEVRDDLEDKSLLDEIADAIALELGVLVEVKKDKKREGEFVFRVIIPEHDDIPDIPELA